MKLPKKISPDRIRDSIVEVRYNSKVPFEIALGMIFKALDNSYIYTNRPVETESAPKPQNVNELTLNFGSYNIFYNEKIKIQLSPGSFIFNCRNSDYIGWEMYLPEIKKVLKQILNDEIIEHFTRIGVRYISDYEDIDLSQCVNFNFSFGMPEVLSEQYSFRTEFYKQNSRIIINLGNKIPKKSLKTNTIVKVTSIDVDSIFDIPKKTGDLNDIITYIKDTHEIEKEMFFKLLNPDFLKKLNPQY